MRRLPSASPRSSPVTTMLPGDDQVVALLRDLLAELRGFRADLRRDRAAAPLADRLIVAVHATVGGEAFTAASLCALAKSPLAIRLELHAICDDIARGLDLPGAGRRVGRFLAKNLHYEADGLRLISLGKVRGGGAYKIEVAAETRNPKNLSVFTWNGRT